VLAEQSSQRDPFHLLDVIRDRGVTVFQATPTTYDMFFATDWKGDANIDFIVSSLTRKFILRPFLAIFE
jgi:non-ribosomal peptide synthetase component F